MKWCQHTESAKANPVWQFNVLGKNRHLCGDSCSLYGFVGYRIQKSSKKCFSPQMTPAFKKAIHVPHKKQPVCKTGVQSQSVLIHPLAHKNPQIKHRFFFGELYLLYVMSFQQLSAAVTSSHIAVLVDSQASVWPKAPTVWIRQTGCDIVQIRNHGLNSTGFILTNGDYKTTTAKDQMI